MATFVGEQALCGYWERAVSADRLALALACRQRQCRGWAESVPVRHTLHAHKRQLLELQREWQPGCPPLCTATDAVELVPACRAGRRLARSAARMCPAWWWQRGGAGAAWASRSCALPRQVAAERWSAAWIFAHVAADNAVRPHEFAKKSEGPARKQAPMLWKCLKGNGPSCGSSSKVQSAT